ncbi:flagellin [Alloyangia pacifica]|uniref:Flagellin n=1 Tax=Alloyangia pacifica TaxID=311180 RepID=A0A1I6SZR5_9RHOB|nr:flagellin [Alloyangia pacifica]SDG92707.1 flagellin [Alloyangia pacifica]SFS82481.1 flagellin [Alloyangia pacifica]
MSSINTNASAMNALSTLRGINKNLESTQSRISTGLKIQSGKDNAAYFSISESMSSDSSVYKAIDEGLTLTKNSISTARLGAESIASLAETFSERVAFAQGDAVDREAIQDELNGLINQMKNTIQQATFNGDDLVNAAQAENIVLGTSGGVLALSVGATAVGVVTGITRDSTGGLDTTAMSFNKVDLSSIVASLSAIDVSDAALSAGDLQTALADAKTAFDDATDAATSLGIAEKSIENQQEFLNNLTDNIDTGVGAMVDADMEEEAARLQALQVQQQLATQSLSIANSSPQSILSLFQ